MAKLPGGAPAFLSASRRRLERRQYPRAILLAPSTGLSPELVTGCKFGFW